MKVGSGFFTVFPASHLAVLAKDIEIPHVHTQKDSLDETCGNNASPNQNFSEDVDLQGTLAQGVSHQGLRIQPVTNQEISDIEKVISVTNQEISDIEKVISVTDQEISDLEKVISDLEKVEDFSKYWKEELRLVKLRNELDPECEEYNDKYFDLPQDVAEHLRELQVIRTCLAKGSLALDKAFREAYMKNTNTPEP